jgi:hypothetical protein
MSQRHKKSNQRGKNWAESQDLNLIRVNGVIKYIDHGHTELVVNCGGRICINGILCMSEATYDKMRDAGFFQDLFQRVKKDWGHRPAKRILSKRRVFQNVVE